eukprot:CAMPEP_0195507992 /NCGR_PEP_ID=MMETSP0794_2-20130614/1315_1 /TAXON_ID=515487 /ORGANISM="Stephanopyxis turris, Strain CCMP 815" /LENGTH=233 /DNA_ID=CAMNT_0040634833 /DNA_START=25 /DNA_END=726 /DNA_ORIENTATION=+
MSKLSDYSKFDHLDGSSSSDDEGINKKQQESFTLTNTFASESISSTTDVKASAEAGSAPSRLGRTKKGSEPGRFIFEHDGRKIYEWEQTLEEVNLYIDTPPGITSANQIECKISPSHLTLGLKNAPHPYLDEATYSKVKVSYSSWCLDMDSGVINVVLAKVYRGEMWDCVLCGKQQDGATVGGVVDPMTKQEIRKELMLERFQEENPGFDFRGAEFNGMVPDARTFMGGVKHT